MVSTLIPPGFGDGPRGVLLRHIGVPREVGAPGSKNLAELARECHSCPSLISTAVGSPVQSSDSSQETATQSNAAEKWLGIAPGGRGSVRAGGGAGSDGASPSR